MTRLNKIVLVTFLGGLSAVVLGFALLDIWLVSTQDKGSSISWAMALLGYEYPIFDFAIGHVTGGLIWGLAAHFWAGMMRPKDREELLRLRAEKAARP